MSASLRFVGAIAFGLLLPIWSGTALARIPLEAFAARPWMGEPQISPNGRHIAVPLAGYRGDTIGVYAMDAPTKVKGITLISQAFVEWIRWANDDRLLVCMTIRGGLRKYGRIYDVSRSYLLALDRDGAHRIELFANRVRFPQNFDLSEIVDDLPYDPNAVLMDARDEMGRDNLYRVNVYNGQLQELARGRPETYRWLTDRKGVPRAHWDLRERRHLIEVYLRRGDAEVWDKAVEFGSRDFAPFNVVGFADDPRTAIVASRQNGDRYALYEYDIAAHALGRLLFEHPTVDIGDPIGGPLYDQVTGNLVGVRYVEDAEHRHYFEPDLAATNARIDALLPDATVVNTVSWSRDRRRIIVSASAPKDPGSYFVYDADKGSLTPIGNARRNISPDELGEMRPYKYVARDGTRIPAYITVPPGKAPKGLPLVVMPHGGPEVRDSLRYDHWVQMLANRGYAVFQPNFRGSGGYGRVFAEAGYGQWGRLMQDDVTDGVRSLIADGMVDRQRICIVGASYGGYAALAGGAFTPDLYKCIVAIAGLSDIPEFLQTRQDQLDDDSALFAYWLRQFGNPRVDGTNLESISPARHAASFTAPVLLIHGDSDDNVPIDQSRIMERALRRAGKSVRFVAIEREDHSLSHGTSDLTVMRELERFLAQHLGQ